MELFKNQKRIYEFKILAIWTIILLLTGCAITMNKIKDSRNTSISNEQRASQKNDSTQLNNNLKF